MAGKGKKGKSKGGKARSQGQKKSPSAGGGAANTSTNVERELITPGALDLRLSDPDIATVEEPEESSKVSSPEASDTVSPEAATPETGKAQTPVAATPPTGKTVGDEKKPVPVIGGPNSVPLAAADGISTQKIHGGKNPFTTPAAGATSTQKAQGNKNPFTTPAAAEPVKEVAPYTPIVKGDAFKDVPISSPKEAVETTQADSKIQPQTNVPTHATPPGGAAPYSQPVKAADETAAYLRKEEVPTTEKLRNDGFEPTPAGKPSPAIMQQKVVPTAEATSYQKPPPAKAAPQPQETSNFVNDSPRTAAQRATAQAGTAGTAASADPPSPAQAAASSSKIPSPGPALETKPKRTSSRKENEAFEFWPAMYASPPEEQRGRKTESPGARIAAGAAPLASPARVPNPLSEHPVPDPKPAHSPSPKSRGQPNISPPLAGAFSHGPSVKTSTPSETKANANDPTYLPPEDTEGGFINPWSRAARISSLPGASPMTDNTVSPAPQDPFVTPLSDPGLRPNKPLPPTPYSTTEQHAPTFAVSPVPSTNPFAASPGAAEHSPAPSSSTSRIPRKPAPKQTARPVGMHDVRLDSLPPGAPGARTRFPSLEVAAPWSMRARNWVRGSSRRKIIAVGVVGVVVVALVVGLAVGLTVRNR